jgi:hypothetical protein
MKLSIKDRIKWLWWTLLRQECVTTIYGLRKTKELTRRDGNFEDENEKTSWVEYYLDGELVHRSVNIALKKGLEIPVFQENLGG